VKKLLEIWIGFQKNNSVLFAFLLLGLIFYGLWTALQSQIEAFPDLTNVQVQVITQFPGKAAEEVERQVTVPLEVATNGIPGLINQRSLSLFGLSVITLTFDDNVASRQARLDVAQHLGDADLPDGVRPSTDADSTPVGEIFRYTLDGSLPVDERRLIQDWTLEKAFKSIPGVADVVSFGGPTRTIDVKIDVSRMKALGLTLAGIAQTLGANHANAGGSIITHGEESYVVRSIGLYENPESLENAVVATQHNTPLRVRDIGKVQLGHLIRLGQVGRGDNDDVVEGIILLRTGGDTLGTCQKIREAVEHLNAEVLPKSVRIVPYYDRTDLIRRSSRTVFHNIVMGVLLVCLLLVLGLGSQYWLMTAAVALIIPFALLTAFVGLRVCGYAPNLISLGSVDFGIIVETAIFAAEAVIVGLGRRKRKDVPGLAGPLAEVLGPAQLCALLLLIAFVPILSLQRVEGRIFKPLGITLVCALLGGQLGAFIFIPLAAEWLPTGSHTNIKTDRFFEWMLRRCTAMGQAISLWKRPGLVWGAFFLLLIGIFWVNLGREFLPNLNEGNLWIRATAPATISREVSASLAAKIRGRLQSIPEVEDTVSQMGRPDDGTDVNGFDTIEIYASLGDPEQWKSAKTIDGFIALAQKKLGDLDGVDLNFSQYIKDNVDEAISGVKGELVLKIFGTNLESLQKLADQVVPILKGVPGAEDVGAEELLGQPEVRFKMDRDSLDRYGLRVVDAEDVLETALSGKFAAKMVDDQGRSVDILVKPDLPDSVDKDTLASLPILTPDGAQIPLGEVSSPSLVEGVSRIYREEGERRVAVKCSVRGRAVVDFVKEADQRIRSKVSLPDKFRLSWSGSFENAQRAGQQLALLVPLCLLATIVILYTWFGNWACVGLLLWELPFAALGGLAALRVAGLNFSISAAAGGVVLIGVSFLTGMMLIEDWVHGRGPWEALREKGRSILLSSGVAIIGLIPASFSHGIGSETARPFAVMILGGLVSSLVFSLVLLPALMQHSRKREG
jgi:cobalt-zinc-cadmium resistance protein CzcA